MAVSEFCVVTTTTDSQAHARALAAQIVQDRLGACVQLQAIESHYIWQGQAEQSSEWRLTIKTRSALYPELERFIRAHHHYDTPQIVCLPPLGRRLLHWWERRPGAIDPGAPSQV
jgi:periplasmic divalent cation tolerance protein